MKNKVIEKLTLIGGPSPLGGADQEVYHQIKVWLDMKIDLTISPTCPLDANTQPIADELISKGVKYEYDIRNVKDTNVISFCSADFLKILPIVKENNNKVIWVNCMCWNPAEEIEAVKNDAIDLHLYQTEHQQASVTKGFGKPVKSMVFKPYFDAEKFPFIKNRPNDRFRFGRIHRPDSGKFNPLTFWVYEQFVSPKDKSCYVLGWDNLIRSYINPQPQDWCILMQPCAMPAQEFYRCCSALIMPENMVENFPRVAMEAMASGTLLVVDNRGGWKELIEDGITGYLCDDVKEYVYKSSRVAYEQEESDKIRSNARIKLLDTLSNKAVAIKEWTRIFEKIG